MSVEIDLNSLTNEHINYIKSHLHLQHKQGFISAANPKIEKFFIEKEKTILLPYLYGGGLMNIKPNNDKNFPNSNLEFNGKLREHQIKMSEDIINHLDKKGTTTLNLPCGTGKTILSVYASCIKKLITLVLVPYTSLIEQWGKEYSTFTNAKVWMIDENKKKLPPILDANVIICYSHISRWEQIPEEMLNSVGMLIIDEGHDMCSTEKIRMLLGTQPRYIIICTATLNKYNGMEQMLYLMGGKHKIEIEEEKRKEFICIKFNTGITPTGLKQTNQGLDWWSLVNFQEESEERNLLAVKIILNNPNKKIIILCYKQDHPKKLCELVKNLTKKSCDYLCSKKKSYNDSDVLIGTIKKIGTGFDEKNACEDFKGVRSDLLIMMGTMKNESTIQQNIGRVFRTDDIPEIFVLVDDHIVCKNHWREIKKWALSKNGRIREISGMGY